METHLSYPFLCFFRSQHDNQSWVAAFAAILDTCALLIAYGEGETKWQAQLTFAIARHAVSDLAQIFSLESRAPAVDRLPEHDLLKMRQLLLDSGVRCGGDSSDEKLKSCACCTNPTSMCSRGCCSCHCQPGDSNRGRRKTRFGEESPHARPVSQNR